MSDPRMNPVLFTAVRHRLGIGALAALLHLDSDFLVVLYKVTYQSVKETLSSVDYLPLLLFILSRISAIHVSYNL